MKTFNISIEIAASSDRVWEVMSDVERWHEWTPSITSIQWRDGGSLAVGHVAVVRQPRLPAARWKVTALEPGKRFVWESTAPGIRTIGHHEVEPSGSGSIARLSVEIKGALGGLLWWLTAGITKRYVSLEATGLKARSEDPEYRHPGLDRA